MDLQSYARILRKRWRIIPAVALLVVALATLLTVLTPKTYQSNIQFFVSTSDSSDSAQLAQGSTFTQQRVKSYTELLKTPKVLGPVVQQLKLPLTPTQLAAHVSTNIPVDTVLIDVSITDRSAARAKAIAKSVSEQFPKTVQDLERVKADSPSPVKVTVVKDPQASPGAVSPRPVRNIALALMLGLLLGVAVAILRHILDSRVRTKEDIEELTDVTVIGGIPYDSEASSQPLIVQADPQSGRAEAFRSLRTNLQFVDVANHPRTIVVTSSLAGEGKTTTTANLALAMAESGASVCLIEGDLRRPRLLDYLGMEGGVGLTDVLIERADLRDVLQPFGKHRLAVLGAGAIPPNPSELLGSTAMRETLARLQSSFDYVLIDAPPLLPVTDAAVLSTLVGGAVLVSGSGIVTRDQLDTALDSLATVNGRVLGIVLNRIPRKSAGGYYDYRYEYRPTEPAKGGRKLGKRGGGKNSGKSSGGGSSSRGGGSSRGGSKTAESDGDGASRGRRTAVSSSSAS
ncbi:polysaccharide biosynthesis tyrosine autokinase [Luteipulveratus mongoliensis]|uniref:polysaccharide biosynthesis tyrosine autokinase n=1 Tax=Luteipulveratus mongoliensis TaxID=571913 RepID=UPI0009FA0364|nr:polysaccharide biosynthesis tyrosine autokinase [Luteipulveratus mongoliensis]